MGRGGAGEAWLRIELIGALASAGRVEDAEAELESFRARDDVSAFLRANAASNLAYQFMIHRQKDKARKWCEHIVERAKKHLSQEFRLPWEE